MNLGLLGALGGLGKGMQQFGQSLFDDQLAERREARLQAIRDKEYARGREDSLADYQMQRTDQLEDAQTDRDFRTGLVNDEREYNEGQFQSFVQGDDGNILGIKRDGTTQDIGGVNALPENLSIRSITNRDGSTMLVVADEKEGTFTPMTASSEASGEETPTPMQESAISRMISANEGLTRAEAIQWLKTKNRW